MLKSGGVAPKQSKAMLPNQEHLPGGQNLGIEILYMTVPLFRSSADQVDSLTSYRGSVIEQCLLYLLLRMQGGGGGEGR